MRTCVVCSFHLSRKRDGDKNQTPTLGWWMAMARGEGAGEELGEAIASSRAPVLRRCACGECGCRCDSFSLSARSLSRCSWLRSRFSISLFCRRLIAIRRAGSRLDCKASSSIPRTKRSLRWKTATLSIYGNKKMTVNNEGRTMRPGDAIGLKKRHRGQGRGEGKACKARPRLLPELRSDQL